MGLLLALLLCSSLPASAQRRAVWGVVTGTAGEPVAGAAVKLSNRVTLKIRSLSPKRTESIRFVVFIPIWTTRSERRRTGSARTPGGSASSQRINQSERTCDLSMPASEDSKSRQIRRRSHEMHGPTAYTSCSAVEGMSSHRTLARIANANRVL